MAHNQQIAAEFSNMFEDVLRQDGDGIMTMVAFKDPCSGSPRQDALSDLVHSHYTDEDTAYRETLHAFKAVADQGLDEVAENLHLYVDSEIDVMTLDIMGWLTANTHWGDLVLEEGLCDPARGIVHIAMCAQAEAYQTIWMAVLDFIRERIYE